MRRAVAYPGRKSAVEMNRGPVLSVNMCPVGPRSSAHYSSVNRNKKIARTIDAEFIHELDAHRLGFIGNNQRTEIML